LHDAQHAGTTFVRLEPDRATLVAADVLEAAGASAEHARTVAEHLVGSDARGVHSHGLLRVEQYVAEIERGEIDGRADPTASAALAGRVLVDGQRAFGQVAAQRAVEEARAAAERLGVGLAATSRSGHAGRIGAYTEELARRGFIGLAFCSGPRSGHRVAPFGGVEGRLATNPISFAAPSDGEPIVADFSTSTVPEGVVRRLRDTGAAAPPGSLQDAEGAPTDDPRVLYQERPGTILPLGGVPFGHKGYALALLVETMTTLLWGEDPADDTRFGNNLTVVAIAVEPRSSSSATSLARYLRATRPLRPELPVLLPGDPERRALEDSAEITLDRNVWASLCALASRLGVDRPDPVGR
jgi:LDH2 family malate/lactate/ureidoglycolate dehydrogenase